MHLADARQNDFAALGVHTISQGIDAVMAVIIINIGEMQVQAVLMIPALPVRLAAAGIRWPWNGSAELPG